MLSPFLFFRLHVFEGRVQVHKLFIWDTENNKQYLVYCALVAFRFWFNKTIAKSVQNGPRNVVCQLIPVNVLALFFFSSETRKTLGS